jgi:hypothetical protein
MSARARALLVAARPHLWAAFILGHCIAIVMLALPGDAVVGRARWASTNTKSDFAGWSRTLGKLGVKMPPDELGKRVYGVAEGYVDVRRSIIAPFTLYREATGTKQGWAMFSSPQRHPVEVHVDGFEGGTWRPLYRTRESFDQGSTNSQWMSTQMDHARLRKLVGRFAREYRENVFNELARYLGNRAFADFAGVERVRVRLYRWDSLPADRIRAGEKPTGKYTQVREWRRESPP